MKLKVTDLKRQLKSYKLKELIDLIADLHKKNKDVQSYLSVRFLGEEAAKELFEQAKKNIANEFFPERGFGKLQLNIAKKAISDFKKLTEDGLRTTDLMLYYVEQGVKFTSIYGDINESFYLSMATMYEKVIIICDEEEEEEYYQIFADRLRAVVTDTSDVGWGFHDQLAYLYSSIQHLEDEEE
ncbi:DUF6155 family protein [Lederbergia citrea]|nr:DUF6155 family protein [Lederbergia citrea]